MDEIDRHIQWCFDNNATICRDEDLQRLAETHERWQRCLACPKLLNPESDKLMPKHIPSECHDCDNYAWFHEHVKQEKQDSPKQEKQDSPKHKYECQHCMDCGEWHPEYGCMFEGTCPNK